MCGNGLRCVALLLRDVGGEDATSFDVETRAGTRRVELVPDGRVSVDMGEPNFTKAAIPMRGPAWETSLHEPLDLGGGVVVTASAVSMGNPHFVLFVEDDPERFHVAHIGAVLERDDRFPEGTNVEFAKGHGRRDRRARVGAGERRDDGVRQRGVRDRGGGERGGAHRSSSDGALPRRRAGGRATRDRLGPPHRTRESPSSRRRSTSMPCGGIRSVMTTAAERLVARAEALVAIPSESRHEDAILAEIRRSLPARTAVVDDEDSVLFALPERRPGAPLVHPRRPRRHGAARPKRPRPPRRRHAPRAGHSRHEGRAGGHAGDRRPPATPDRGPGLDSDLDVGLLFFGREELPFAESALVPLFDRRPEIAEPPLAIVLEPTANRLELGCLGNLNARSSSTARQPTPPGRGSAGTRSTPRSPLSRR